MAYLIEIIGNVLMKYQAWLSEGKHRAAIIFTTPVAIGFVALMVLPDHMLQTYYTSEIVALVVPLVIFPLMPFYVVTYFCWQRNRH